MDLQPGRFFARADRFRVRAAHVAWVRSDERPQRHLFHGPATACRGTSRVPGPGLRGRPGAAGARGADAGPGQPGGGLFHHHPARRRIGKPKASSRTDRTHRSQYRLHARRTDRAGRLDATRSWSASAKAAAASCTSLNRPNRCVVSRRSVQCAECLARRQPRRVQRPALSVDLGESLARR